VLFLTVKVGNDSEIYSPNRQSLFITFITERVDLKEGNASCFTNGIESIWFTSLDSPMIKTNANSHRQLIIRDDRND